MLFSDIYIYHNCKIIIFFNKVIKCLRVYKYNWLRSRVDNGVVENIKPEVFHTHI